MLSSDRRRLLLVFADQQVDSLQSYAEFMQSQCGFHRLDQRLPQNGSDLCSNDQIFYESTIQIICVVLRSEASSCHMEDYLKFLSRFSEDVDQLLLYCCIRQESPRSESTNDDELKAEFSNPKFRYKTCKICYLADTEANIDTFFTSLLKRKTEYWKEDTCLHDILDGLDYPSDIRNTKKNFLRDIKSPRTPQNTGTPDAERFTNHIDERAASSLKDFIYPNQRDTKPKALIILNVADPSSGIKFKSMHEDWSQLVQLFDKLQFQVRDVQNRAGSTGARDRVKEFAESTFHGDSCALVILSETRLDLTFLENISKAMSTSQKLQNKPRLILLQDWEAAQGRDADYGVPAQLPSFLPSAVASMRRRWKNQDVSEGAHRHCGMIWCQSAVSGPDGDSGSALFRTLCTTFLTHSNTLDVVSMIPLINQELRDAAPRWCVQTTKLFYITDTSKKSSSDYVSPEAEGKHKTSRNQSLALVINNEFNQHSNRRMVRNGSQKDTQKLKATFEGLGYNVVEKSELNGKEIVSEVRKFATQSGHGDACVVAIMSHGRLGKIIGIDDETASEKEILEILNASESLTGKQKLIIFQACRPPADSGAPSSSDHPTLLVYPDMIVAHSTSPGDLSTRHSGEGSRFVQSLCAVLDEFAADNDVVTLISAVNHMVVTSFGSRAGADEEAQLPCWLVHTRGPFILGTGSDSF